MTNIKDLIITNCTNPPALAYLWMALENGQNIIITGAPGSGKASLLMALHALMPFYERIITVGEETNRLVFYENIDSMVPFQGNFKERQKKIKGQVTSAIAMSPDRIVIDEIRGEEARIMFSGANNGIPFITTAQGNGTGWGLVSALKSAPMLVEDHTSCMLDVSVLMDKAVLEEILEYRWLCRAELESGTQQQLMELQMNKMTTNGNLNAAMLSESKVIMAYAGRNMIGIKESISEFNKRSNFIAKLAQDQSVVSSFDVYKAVMRYWEMQEA